MLDLSTEREQSVALWKTVEQKWIYVKQVREKRGNCVFSPGMCFLRGENRARSYCHCRSVDPSSQDNIGPRDYEFFCRTWLKTMTVGVRVRKPCLYMKDPCACSNRSWGLQATWKCLICKYFCSVRSLRGFVGIVSSCFLRHHRFGQKENSSLDEQWSHCVGLALSSGQRHASDKLRVCAWPFVLPERSMTGREQSSPALWQGEVSPLRTAEEEKRRGSSNDSHGQSSSSTSLYTRS